MTDKNVKMQCNGIKYGSSIMPVSVRLVTLYALLLQTFLSPAAAPVGCGPEDS